MNVLFTQQMIGNVELKNRFVHSATYEGMADPDGKVTEDLIKRYRLLAQGDVGLIIPGFMYIHPLGRAYKAPIGIHSNEMIEGLKNLVKAVHEFDSKIFFQLNHAGQQTSSADIGQTPLGPSSSVRDPINFFKPKQMNENEIKEAADAYVHAAERAVKAGADGVQVHCAHGYLINQFLSPFFNRRQDKWGGSSENRFRFLKQVIQAIQAKVPNDFCITVKLNTNDFTPKQGITPELAVEYAGMLKKLGIDMIEVSCGSSIFSYMNMCRGDVPVKEMVQSMPLWKKPVAWLMIQSLKGKYDLDEGYNIKAARAIKPVIGNIPLGIVGGMRTLDKMSQVITNQDADLISMCRPFIREPFIIKNFKENKKDKVSCISCNRCLAAVPNGFPIRCYNKDFPKKI
ncbi:NADH:flavin oxidoreductase [Desulfobacula sp.]|uniref:NADH:flavin oxidoreductase n=1 Tax=Desulfobacula sp. TaxID=2593537 RepID=UPI002608103B|nr:NADH:flavin oxidoreductase [Desulfobacula sp.]